MDYDGLWMTLWIASAFMTTTYIGLGSHVFIKYLGILDPFQKVAIIAYSVAFIVKTVFWVISWQCAEYNEKNYLDTTKPLIPVQSTLGALVAGMSFIILQVIIFRIFVAYDQLKVKDEEEKKERATKQFRIMYYYIGFYIAMLIGKLFLDYKNDIRLEIYRLPCKGVGLTSSTAVFEKLLRDEINLCDSDYEYAGTPRNVLIPIAIIAVTKILIDLGIVFAGIVVFYKLCNYISPDNQKHVTTKISFKNVLFIGAIYLCFLMFIARIIIKDVLYQLLSIDEIYLTSCRCYKKIESFFVI